MRNIVSQKRSSFDLRFVMDRQRLLIVNLSVGRVGESEASLLGSLLTTGTLLAALSRVEVPPKERVACYFYVDEFQSVGTESFARLLDEIRKFRVGVVLAHQRLAQLTEELRSAVLTNCRTTVSFQVSADDAEQISREFSGDVVPGQLLELPPFRAYLRPFSGGETRQALRLKTPKPRQPSSREQEAIMTKRRQNLITQSRMRFDRSRTRVEEEVRRQLR